MSSAKVREDLQVLAEVVNTLGQQSQVALELERGWRPGVGSSLPILQDIINAVRHLDDENNQRVAMANAALFDVVEGLQLVHGLLEHTYEQLALARSRLTELEKKGASAADAVVAKRGREEGSSEGSSSVMVLDAEGVKRPRPQYPMRPCAHSCARGRVADVTAVAVKRGKLVMRAPEREHRERASKWDALEKIYKRR